MWTFVMLLKYLFFLLGLNRLRELRTTQIFRVSNFWNEKLKELSVKLQIKKHVRLLQSRLAKVPMVIGHLKPVILIPFGLFAALTQEEVEAILLHELAHIKRNDYLINLLQTFIQTIFFFNPGVLWMSSVLRNERENCCDDIAVTYLHNKTNYINALVAFRNTI
jgi:beta-lactamase regulating signal transducer with metallopeptidase domain